MGQGTQNSNSEFGPVMTAYLGYLSNEQEVVDDRASRREISTSYYRRNSSRINALRIMATRLVRESGNDYVPELEAVALDEFGTIFEHAPKPSSLRPNEVIANKFRFLGPVRVGETFYLFARLNPYEQADLMQQARIGKRDSIGGEAGVKEQRPGEPATRVRKIGPR
jgi:hypothetical protein